MKTNFPFVERMVHTLSLRDMLLIAVVGVILPALAVHHATAATNGQPTIQVDFDLRYDAPSKSQVFHVSGKTSLPSGTIIHVRVSFVKTRIRPDPRSQKIYVTEEGDTLKTISKKFFGDDESWEVIYQENKAILREPENIKPGTRIVIPGPMVQVKDYLTLDDDPNVWIEDGRFKTDLYYTTREILSGTYAVHVTFDPDDQPKELIPAVSHMESVEVELEKDFGKPEEFPDEVRKLKAEIASDLEMLMELHRAVRDEISSGMIDMIRWQQFEGSLRKQLDDVDVRNAQRKAFDFLDIVAVTYGYMETIVEILRETMDSVSERMEKGQLDKETIDSMMAELKGCEEVIDTVVRMTGLGTKLNREAALEKLAEIETLLTEMNLKVEKADGVPQEEFRQEWMAWQSSWRARVAVKMIQLHQLLPDWGLEEQAELARCIGEFMDSCSEDLGTGGRLSSEKVSSLRNRVWEAFRKLADLEVLKQ